MWSKNYWMGLLENALGAASAAALGVVGTDVVFNAITADFASIGGVALGGALVSILKSLAVRDVGAVDSPSVTR